MNKFDRNFYLQDTLKVAKELIGMYIVRNYNGTELIMKITETEAYIGSIDKACHAYGGRRTKRTEIMYGIGGYAYIYLIYGMYNCFNIVTEEKEKACAVLIRGGSPEKGINEMSQLRYEKAYNELTAYQIKNFANGPGKLCIAMKITKELNEKDLLSDDFYIAKGKKQNYDIKCSKRINIDYAEEAKDFLWRFYV